VYPPPGISAGSLPLFDFMTFGGIFDGVVVPEAGNSLRSAVPSTTLMVTGISTGTLGILFMISGGNLQGIINYYKFKEELT